MQEDEFVARPERGRVVTIARHAGLGDVRPDTTVRLDGLARYLQDVADRDAASAAVEGAGVWVLRRLVMRIDRTPRFRADLTLSTWCSGVGARWAERRTDIMLGGARCVTAAGLWVHVDTATRRPCAPARRLRRAVGRLGERPPRARGPAAQVVAGARRRHVVAAARLGPRRARSCQQRRVLGARRSRSFARRGSPRVTRAEMEFRDGLDLGDDVTVRIVDTADGFACWFRVGGDVRASALVACRAMTAVTLTAEEARVLGCLMEKAVTTPDGYPLSLNSVVTACNQTTNRDPIVSYSDELVDRTLEQLREKGLSRRVMATGQRVVKHRHVAEEGLAINAGEFAVIGVLLLRGAQTPGELKGRTERWHRFRSLEDVQEVLDRLSARELTKQLPRRPGQKESRWAQLLTGDEVFDAAPVPPARPGHGVRRPGRADGGGTRGPGAGPGAARAALTRHPEPRDRHDGADGRDHRAG